MVNMKVMLGISHTLFFKKRIFFAAETRPLAWGPPSESCWMLLWPLLELLFFKKERGAVQSPFSLLPYSVLDSRVLVNLSESTGFLYIFQFYSSE